MDTSEQIKLEAASDILATLCSVVAAITKQPDTKISLVSGDIESRNCSCEPKDGCVEKELLSRRGEKKSDNWP